MANPLKRIHPSTTNHNECSPSDENSMLAPSPLRTDALRSFITTASWQLRQSRCCPNGRPFAKAFWVPKGPRLGHSRQPYCRELLEMDSRCSPSASAAWRKSSCGLVHGVDSHWSMVYFDPFVYARWQFLVCFGKMWIIEENKWNIFVDLQCSPTFPNSLGIRR